MGRIGGPQDLQLASTTLVFESDYTRGVIVHELLHALGMYHEQCRYDRDNYVTVNYGNIVNGTANSEYRKETQNYFTMGSFDFNSIMLYPSRGQQAINSSIATMTRKNGTEWDDNNYLSENDRKWLNYFYLPYIARKDVCMELDAVVYDGNNNRLTPTQIVELERQLNSGRCSYPLPNR